MRMPRGDAPQRAARLSKVFAPSPMAVNTPSSIPARSAAVRWYALTVSQKATGLGSGGAVAEAAFAGSTRPAIRKVLRRFDVARTVEFFADLGVALKREETGKLFPVSDRARTVLDALLRSARDAAVAVQHPWRVEAVDRKEGAFLLRSA